MKLGFYLFLVLTFAASSVAGQSARVKASPTPSSNPNPSLRPSVLYVPTQIPQKPAPVADSRPRVSASSTPVPVTDEGLVKVESTLIPIPASVVDGHGRPIVNLKLADFELRIDGKNAEISDITRAETPIRLALMFDNSSSVIIAREFEKEAAIRFFRRVILPERDLAALFSVADVTRLEQPMTRDISALVNAIQSFPPPRGATALLDGIVEVTGYLRSAEGRRVLVIVSDGEDTISDYATTLEKVIRELQTANVQVYVVKTKDFENFKRTGQRGGNANIRALDAERRMIEITKQTGGSVFSPIDERELDEAFRQISAELSQQYILSYYPEDPASDRGQFRQISLSIKSRPNVNVRTRQGYYVPKR
jgi:Ca-activated chloride channel family protein